MSEDDKTRAAAQGIKFSEFKQVTNQEGNPVQVVGLRDGENVRAVLTTDLVATEPEVVFRNSKGQFAAVDPGLLLLDNQLKVNRYFYNWMLEQGVTIDPAPPGTPADGALWFCNLESSMQLFVFHEESDAWIPVAPPASIADRVAAGEDIQSGLVEAVGALETKVTALEGAVGEHSLVFSSGMTPEDGEFTITIDGMSASNTLSGGTVITMSGTDRNGNSIAIDRITEGDVLRLSDISSTTAELKITSVNGGGAFGYEKLFGDLDRLSEYPYDLNLFSSFDPQGLATIDYVDERDDTKIGKGGNQALYNGTRWQLRQLDNDGVVRALITIEDGKMNLGHVATPSLDDDAVNKSYVDEAIAAALANMPSATPKPANFSWLYGGESEWYPSPYAFFTDGNSFKLSLKTYCGNAGSGPVITEGSYKEWNASNGSAIEMSFWYLRNDGSWKMLKHVEIDKVYWMESQGGVTYMRFHKKWQSNSNSFTTNREYYITVGGFF